MSNFDKSLVKNFAPLKNNRSIFFYHFFFKLISCKSTYESKENRFVILIVLYFANLACTICYKLTEDLVEKQATRNFGERGGVCPRSARWNWHSFFFFFFFTYVYREREHGWYKPIPSKLRVIKQDK